MDRDSKKISFLRGEKHNTGFIATTKFFVFTLMSNSSSSSSSSDTSSSSSSSSSLADFSASLLALSLSRSLISSSRFFWIAASCELQNRFHSFCAFSYFSKFHIPERKSLTLFCNFFSLILRFFSFLRSRRSFHFCNLGGSRRPMTSETSTARITAASGNRPCSPRYWQSSRLDGNPSRMKPVDLSKNVKKTKQLVLPQKQNNKGN